MGRVSALPQGTGKRSLTLRPIHTLAATADALNAEGSTQPPTAKWTVDMVLKVREAAECSSLLDF